MIMKKTLLTVAVILLLTAVLMVPALADAVSFDYDTWEATDYYVYVTTPDGGLNLRDEPNVNCKVWDLIPDYVRLHIMGVIDGTWGYTMYNGQYGYVFLGQTSPSLPQTPADYYVYVTTPDGGLNLREGPGTDYGILVLIPDYVQLHITAVAANNWGEAAYNGMTGWVSLNQTSETLPAEAASQVSLSEQATEESEQPGSSSPDADDGFIKPYEHSPGREADDTTAEPSGGPLPPDTVEGDSESLTVYAAPDESTDNSTKTLKTYMLIIIGLCVVVVVILALLLIVLLNRRSSAKK